MTYDERVAQAGDARLAAYAAIGEPSADVLAPILGPLLTGGPEWPTRPAWRPIRRATTVALTSDALSDPWEDRPGAGYRMEVFAEGPAELWPAGVALTAIAGTWLFSVVSEISNVVAGHGGVRELLDELGAVSVEVEGDRFPAHLRNEHGRVGVLLGVPARDVPDRFRFPGGDDVRWVAITVLTREELDRVVKGGDAARVALTAALAASPAGHVSDLSRPSVAF